jgi:UDP-N-acetylmuramate dehydrogenase
LDGKNLFLLKTAFTTEENYDFAKNSTIGVGGISPLAVFPNTLQQAVCLLDFFRKENQPFYPLGNLSNILPTDGVSKRLVFSTKKLNTVSQEKGLFVEAGVTSGALLSFCKQRALTGAEFLFGIPCTLGGALYMNAGVSGKYISEIVESVTAYIDGKVETLSVEDCNYAYKQSVFMQTDGVILGARLRLKVATSEDVSRKIADYAERRLHLPKGKSMGCVFKNPPDVSAGKLVEGAGLKGMRLGGAVVSKEHANFIINDKKATAKDIKSLILLIKNAVFAQYKIRLEEEIRYLE